MFPARTASPPNFFTPRRLDSESRPLRDEPPAFLCAMILLLCAFGAYIPYERVRVPFQARFLRPGLLLGEFLGLFAPVLYLVGAERHRFVYAGNVLVGQLGKLGEGGDALLVEILRRHRANALYDGEVVRLALRRLEQRRCGCWLFGLCLVVRFGLCLGLGSGLLRWLGPAGQYLRDANGGEQLPMTDLAAGILPAALLERNDGLGLALRHDFRGHGGAVHERLAESDIVALAMREYLPDFDDVADLALDLLDLQYIVGGDAILLAARFDDCEHFLPFAVRSASMNRLDPGGCGSGRLFVSLRVQKTSGAERLHAGCAPSLVEGCNRVKMSALRRALLPLAAPGHGSACGGFAMPAPGAQGRSHAFGKCEDAAWRVDESRQLAIEKPASRRAFARKPAARGDFNHNRFPFADVTGGLEKWLSG